MSNSTIALTFSAINRIKPNGKLRWLTDKRQAGLQLCVTEAGTKNWYLRKRIRGKDVRQKLGQFPTLSVEDARALARRQLISLERGDDGKPTGRATFKTAFNYWLNSKAKKSKKTWMEDVRKFERDLLPLHARQLKDLNKPDIESLHSGLAETNGPVLANRCLALIKTVFNYAIDEDFPYFGTNPARTVTRYDEQSRERYLMPAEMRRFLESVKNEPEELYRDFFTLLLFTGVRVGNLREMQWKDVDLEFKVWHIGEAKGGTPILVNLVPYVVDVLDRRLQSKRCGWVFPPSINRGRT